MPVQDRKVPQRVQALRLSLDLLCRPKGLQFWRSLDDLAIILRPNALNFGNLRHRSAGSRPAGIANSSQTPFDFR
jgi:hypothetical protein